MTAPYTHDLGDGLGLQAALNMRHQSTSHADLEGDPLYTLPGQDLVNASIGVHTLDDRWEFQVWGRNLGDEYYWTALSSNANVVVRFPGQPRTYGASLTHKF